MRSRGPVQTVIDVHNVETEPQLGLQPTQQMEQRDRVGSAGGGDDHSLTAAEHPLARHGVTYLWQYLRWWKTGRHEFVVAAGRLELPTPRV